MSLAEPVSATVMLKKPSAVKTLLEWSVDQLVLSLPPMDVLTSLPPHLKDLIRRLLLKRGISGPMSALLHDKVAELSFCECRHVDNLSHLLQKTPNLRKLDLNFTGASAADFSLGNLRVLYARETPTDDDCLKRIALGCPHLEELDVGRCPRVGDSGVAALAALNALHSVSLNGTAVTDAGLTEFAAGGNNRDCLRELRIDGCRGVTDDGVEAILTMCRGLRIFIFHNCPGVTERARLALEDYLMEARVAVLQLTWTVY